ncbi:MAG: hypothetical protein IAE79_21735 [Anaerolinea sp.]|nr:hypothetical protein [Anaerolinea sp.]
MFRKLVVTNLLLVFALFLTACSAAVGAGSSPPANENEALGKATLAGLEAIGWDVTNFTAVTEAVDKDYARVRVESNNPPGGFNVFLQRQQGSWQVIAHGSAFDPAELRGLGVPDSVLGPLSGSGPSAEPSDEDAIVDSALTGLAEMGWKETFDARMMAREDDYARVEVESLDPTAPGGFTVLLMRRDGAWQIIYTGSSFNPQALAGYVLPESVLPETWRQAETSVFDLLRRAGGQIEMSGEDVLQPFFSIHGEIARLNGQDVQLFNYPTEAEAIAAANEVAPDGRSIGTHSIAWLATPHFFRSGSTLLLYVGDDADTLALLTAALGEPFAGGSSK